MRICIVGHDNWYNNGCVTKAPLWLPGPPNTCGPTAHAQDIQIQRGGFVPVVQARPREILELARDMVSAVDGVPDFLGQSFKSCILRLDLIPLR